MRWAAERGADSKYSSWTLDDAQSTYGRVTPHVAIRFMHGNRVLLEATVLRRKGLLTMND